MADIKRNTVIRMVAALFVFAAVFGLALQLLKVQEFLISGSIYYICLIAFLIYTVKGTEKSTLASLGVGFNNMPGKILLGFGICAGLSLFQLVFVLFGENLNFQRSGWKDIIVYTFYYICFVGFAEELIFRGYLLKRLNELLNSKIYAVLLSSTLFALWHYPVRYYWGQVIFAFFFGLVLSIIAVRAKSEIIIPLAIGHGLYNSLPLWVGYFIK